jgi:hypothetical protein
VQDLLENLAENRETAWDHLMGILHFVDPLSWHHGEGFGQSGVVGLMQNFESPAAPAALVIRQTPAAHAQIEDLLEQLRQLYASPTGKADDNAVRAAGHTVQEEK